MPALIGELVQRIRPMLRCGDTAQIQQALELVFSLDDPDLYDALLSGCGTSPAGDGGPPTLRLGDNLTPSGGAREHARMRWAALRLLARAPTALLACALRQGVTSLRLDSPVVDLGDLTTAFPLLEVLELRRAKVWRHPEALSRLGALRELVLVNCVPPEGLLYPAGLRRLASSGDRHLSDLTPLSALSSLEALELVQADALCSLAGLPASVTSLSISRARALTDLSALSALSSLEALELRACPSLRGLDALEGLEQLQQLTVEGCRGVRSLLPLRGCGALEVLALADVQLSCLDGVQGAAALREVSLSVPRLGSLAALPPLQSLRLVAMADWSEMPEVAVLVWEGEISAELLQQLPAEKVGVVVLQEQAADPELVPEGLSGKIRWVA